MPDELPPLGKFVITSFEANDLAWPVVAVARDPRAPGYELPATGDACPDPRYSSTHKFTSVTSTHLDNRALWKYEKLPGPILTSKPYDNARGSVTSSTQRILKTGSEAGVIAYDTGTHIFTEISYQEDENDAILHKLVESFVLPGPSLVSVKYDADADVNITTTRTLKLLSNITEGSSISGTDITITESEPVNALIGYEVVTVIPNSAHNDLASAKVEDKMQPWQFPARVDLTTFSIVGGLPVGYRKPSVATVLITTKTFWVNNATKPTLAFDDMDFGDTIYLPGFSLQDCIHDAITLDYGGGLIVTYPDTVPSFTTFVGSWEGTARVIRGSVTNDKHSSRWKVESTSIVMR